MPTLSSLTRSLTLPLNRTRSRRHRSNTTNVDPLDERDLSPGAIEHSVTHPSAFPRRYNPFTAKSPSNSNGGTSNKLNGTVRSNTNPNLNLNAAGFVVPPYIAPDSASPQNVVFGKPLKESLKYASVQISTANSNGELYVWGYIPVVVAKCGLYLKENATEVPGTFRVNGSSRRMRDLQAAFETPPRYGKNLDWKQESYTTHDVASVFRRYLTQMPEPVIPYDLYHQFRDALGKEPYNQEEVIAKYKSLIRQMPRANQYLMLYVLDLLSVFARKSDKNLMTATNLAVIFRPGLISHPQHEMSPQEHALSQKVLEFLIAHQDWFMLDISPPAGRRGSSQQQPHQGHERRGSDQLGSPSSSNANPSAFPSPHHQQTPSGGQPTNSSQFQAFQQQQQLQQQQLLAASPWTNPASTNIAGVPPLSPNLLYSPSLVATTGHGGSSDVSTNVNVSSNNGMSAHHPSHAPPPPPSATRSRPLSDLGSDVDDVMVIPSSAEEEEFSGGGGGGWRLVTKAQGLKEKERIKMMRRRTTMERSDLQHRGSVLTEGDMSSPIEPDAPIVNSHNPFAGGPTVTVQRSRTLPSSRRKDNITNHSGELVLSASTGKENIVVNMKEQQLHAALREGKEKRSVLKKSRRASSNVLEREKLERERERTS